MASLNKFIGIGNLTKEVDVKYMPNGDAVANFSIACNETWKGKDGQKQERTEFINIVMYRKLAEIAGQYLKKGASVYIEGKLQTRKYEKDGVTRYSTEIVADSMQMLGGNRESGGSTSYDSPKEAPKSSNPSDFSDFDDSIPF